MTAPQSYPALPPLAISEAITAPDLATRPVAPCGGFGNERQDAQTLRAALAAGEEWYPSRAHAMAWGKAAAAAAIYGNETALNDIALLLVNGLKYPIKAGAENPLDQIAEDMIQELVEEGRRDLFRPIVLAINNAGRQRWAWAAADRAAWRRQHDIPTIESGENIPAMRDLSETEQNFLNGRWLPPTIGRMFAGKMGWDRVCSALFTCSANMILWNVPKQRGGHTITSLELVVSRITEILAMQRDALVTIADAKPWAPWAILETVRSGRVYDDFWDNTTNRDTLITIAKELNDAEACSLIRRISETENDVYPDDIPRSENTFLNACIDQRSHLGLSDWLARGVRSDLLLDGVDLGIDEIPAINDVRTLTQYLLNHPEQAPKWAQIAERIVGVVGGERMTPEAQADSEADLSDLINLFQALECGASPDGTLKRFPCVQVALDRMLLMRPAHDPVDGSIHKEASWESNPAVETDARMVDGGAPAAERRRQRTI